jgi:hypothetical protein
MNDPHVERYKWARSNFPGRNSILKVMFGERQNFFLCADLCVQCCIIFDIIVLNIEVGGKGEDGSHFDMMRSVA